MTDANEIAARIAVELIRKSGVSEWTDLTKQAEVAGAAAEMANLIVYLTGGSDMANAIYLDHGTAIVFGSEGGDDVAWSTENISNSAGRQSALHDQGADGTSRPWAWRYRIYTQAQATPTVGNLLRLYLKTSDGTHPDNDDGTGDAAVSAEDKLRNLTPLKSIVVDQAAADIEFVSTGTILIPQRHFGVVLWNAMGSAITNDAAETKAVFTPIFHDIQ